MALPIVSLKTLNLLFNLPKFITSFSPGDISPKNLVLRPAAKPYHMLKISNFRRAVVYWDVEKNDVSFLPCLPVEEQKSKVEGTGSPGTFQAPECYGDPAKEAFDPIIADTWSYGAVLFFMAVGGTAAGSGQGSAAATSGSAAASTNPRRYPYDPAKSSKDLEAEVQASVQSLGGLSAPGKALLSELLKTNATERMPHGHIERSEWFEVAKNVREKKIIKKNLLNLNLPSSSSSDQSGHHGGRRRSKGA